MKKQICAIAIASAVSMPAMADFFGIYAGIDYHTAATNLTHGSDFEDNNSLSGYVAVEHFIPLIPNAKLRYSDLSAEDKVSFEEPSSYALNAIGYYEIFDNDLFELDLGLAYSRFENVSDKSTDIIQGYGAAKVFVPGVGMYAFTEVVAGSIADDEATDIELGLAYTFNPDSALINLTVRAGYRYQEMIIDDETQETKGLFAGLEAHF